MKEQNHGQPAGGQVFVLPSCGNIAWKSLQGFDQKRGFVIYVKVGKK